VYELAVELIEQTPHKMFTMNKRRMYETIDQFLEGPKEERIVLLASNDKDEPVAFAMAFLWQPIFSEDKVAQEVGWYTRPLARKTSVPIRLLLAMEFWAKQCGASTFLSGYSSGFNPKLTKFYERRGYKLLEQVFFKEL
jgi:GNAT superfamily N-acetyltransferase